MTTRDEELRLFVAIELPNNVRDALGRLQTELRRCGLERLRWVRPEGIHLTLKFLGETPSDRVPAIKEALAGAAEGMRVHSLSLGRAGTFGGNRNPRVLWVDLTGDSQTLDSLQSRVDEALARIGFPREGRAFAPHLTLARVRPEATREDAGPLQTALASLSVPATEFQAREVSLMHSTLGPGGAVYERLAAFPLVE